MHCVVTRPGSTKKGVSTVAERACHFAVPLPVATLTSARLENHTLGCAAPPASAAGLLHATALSPLARPKSDLSGGGVLARNDTQAIAQPVWPALRHNGVDLKDPPTSCPLGTIRFAPIGITETICRCTGLPS